jgi:hypothetical protein
LTVIFFRYQGCRSVVADGRYTESFPSPQKQTITLDYMLVMFCRIVIKTVAE